MSSRIPDDAFSYYASLGPTRSYRAVARKYGVSKRAVTKLAAREQWSERLAQIEATAREILDKKLVDERVEMQERNLRMVRLMAARAVEGLGRFQATSYSESVRGGELSIKLGRLLMGEPSEHTAVSVEEKFRSEYQRWMVPVEDEDGADQEASAEDTDDPDELEDGPE